MAEEDEVEVILEQEPAADQEVPREAVLPEQSPGEFDFNEFFNLDKVLGFGECSSMLIINHNWSSQLGLNLT